MHKSARDRGHGGCVRRRLRRDPLQEQDLGNGRSNCKKHTSGCFEGRVPAGKVEPGHVQCGRKGATRRSGRLEAPSRHVRNRFAGWPRPATRAGMAAQAVEDAPGPSGEKVSSTRRRNRSGRYASDARPSACRGPGAPAREWARSMRARPVAAAQGISATGTPIPEDLTTTARSPRSPRSQGVHVQGREARTSDRRSTTQNGEMVRLGEDHGIPTH